jgi:Sec-independent protein secretion pathway component TatC
MVSIEKLKAFRSYFVVLAFIIAAVVTPPDVVSQLALAIPMCLLYELGIWAAQLFIRHTQAPADPDKASSSDVAPVHTPPDAASEASDSSTRSTTSSSQGQP